MGKLNINNGGVDTNKVMPSIDERFGPYASREAVEAEFGKEGRDAKCAGLTVGVTQSDGSVKEFWYQPDGQGGLELVEKQAESSNVFGYYNSSNGKFYKEDSYKTEITGGEDKIYIDLSTNTMLRYDVAGSVYEPLGDSEVDKRVNGVVKESYYKRTSANVGEYAEYGTNYNSSWRYLDLSVRKGETVFYKAVGHYGSNPIQPVSFVDSNGILKLKIEYSSQNPICEGVYTAPSDGVFTINMREDSSGWDDAYLYVIRASSERKVSGVVNNSKYKRTESENNDYANYDIVGNPNWRYIDLSVRKDETVFYRSVGHSGIVQPASFADSNGILRMLIQAPSSTTTYENTYTAPDNGVFTVNVRHDDGGWDDAYLYVIRSSSGGGASNESVIQLADFVDGMQGRDGVRVSRASMENAGVIDLSEIFPHMNKFGNKLQLTAKVTTMGTLQFRFGPIPASGYIEAYGYHLLTIDDTNIKLYKAIESDILTDTVPHGLTITDYISVNLNCLADGTMKVEVNTNDNNLNSTGRFSCVLDKWNYGVGHIRVISDQCVLTDVQLSVTNEMFRCPFWMFGASQEGLSDIRYAGQLMKMGYLNVLDNARSGRTSEYLIEDLRRALVFGCPKYLFYTFSNDGLDPNVYEQRVNTIIDIADSHDIKLIVKIVAVVSVGEDGAKELAKRNFILNLLSENKIYRVFDFGKAVSANPTDPNELYEGYLDSALIHPKNAKAATAVAMQFLADVPEIMQYGVKSAEITVDDALSSTSENPVQNKVVKSALDAKANASDIPSVPTISTNIESDANSDTKTASPKAVKTFVEGKGYLTQHQDISGKVDKVANATENNFASFDSNGNLQNSGCNEGSFATAVQGAKADTAYQKPQTGIPESDLSSDVQQALQKHFKGWYDNSSNLPANPVVGDYAYVKGAESTDPAAIYECTTAGSWSNSGRTADTSNVQTFASGEEVNEVGIDSEPTAGSDNLVKSEGVYNVLPKNTKSISSANNFVAGAMVVSNNTVVYDSSDTWNPYLVIGKTTPIHLKADDVLNVKNGNAIYVNKNVSVVTKVTDFGTANESYECLVKGTGLTTSKYVYVATEDMDVFISGPSQSGIKNGNFIASTDRIVGGLSFIKDCIISEAFTVSSCVRDSDGNVSSANIVYPDEVTGTLVITRDDNGNVSSAAYTYKTESYTLTITRDSDGNVLTTSFN